MWPFTPGTWARALRFTKPSAAACCAGQRFHPAGEKLLALVDLGGVTLELIQSPTPVSMEEGNLPHFAIYVDDVDAAAADLRSAGVDTFLHSRKNGWCRASSAVWKTGFSPAPPVNRSNF